MPGLDQGCRHCESFINLSLTQYIAWRPVGKVPEPNEPGYKPHWKDDLPREYLVKFAEKGFRQMTWVPHAWARAMSPQKLRMFLEKGPALDLITDETLAAKGDDMAAPTIANVVDAEEAKMPKTTAKPGDWLAEGPPPDMDAESGVPVAWSVSVGVMRCSLIDCRSCPRRVPSYPSE